MYQWRKMSLRKKYLITLGSSYILFAMMSVILIFQVNNNKRWSDELNNLSTHIKEIDTLSKNFSALYIAIIHYSGDPLPKFEDSFQQNEVTLNKQIKGESYSLSQRDQEFINKELQRIENLNHTITSSTAHIEHTNQILLENKSTISKLSNLVDDVHEQTKGMYNTTEKFSLS